MPQQDRSAAGEPLELFQRGEIEDHPRSLIGADPAESQWSQGSPRSSALVAIGLGQTTWDRAATAPSWGYSLHEEAGWHQARDPGLTPRPRPQLPPDQHTLRRSRRGGSP